MAVCAVIAGATSFAAIADWLHDLVDLDDLARARLGRIRRIPAATTIWRLLTRLDADQVNAALAGWLRTPTPPPAEPRPRRCRIVIAVDGKTLRATRRPDGTQIHLLSALDTSTGTVLAQVTVSAKGNEIPAFAPLLDAVETALGSLAGLVFVADARQTQTAHADLVAARGAHLMIPAKANQPTLFAQLKAPPWAQVPVGDRTRDHGHGRRETRTVKALTVATPGGIHFPHAQQAVRIIWPRTVVVHHIRDVTFRKNAHQARPGPGPTILATLRSAALSFHHTNGETNIARAARRADRPPHGLITAVTNSCPRTQ